MTLSSQCYNKTMLNKLTLSKDLPYLVIWSEDTVSSQTHHLYVLTTYRGGFSPQCPRRKVSR